MGKQWKKNLFWKIYGVVVKPNPIKYNENLDMFGFQSQNSKENRKSCLEALIRQGVPCRFHSTYYLKEWRLLE